MSQNPESIHEKPAIDLLLERVPAHHQELVRFFWNRAKEDGMALQPAYGLGNFIDGIAPFNPDPASVAGLDYFAEHGGKDDEPLIPNYKEAFYGASGEYYPPVCGAMDHVADLINNARQKRAVVFVAPHTSLATPYPLARSLIHTFGEGIRKDIVVVVGPFPTVFEITVGKGENQTVIDPIDTGQLVASLLVTGPKTDSTKNSNEELEGALHTLRRLFWKQYLKAVAEKKMIIVEPAGRRARKNGVNPVSFTEYRSDDDLKYLINDPARGIDIDVMPVGIFDQLLVDPANPSSPVLIHPDTQLWHPVNRPDVTGVHNRACVLACNPYAKIVLEGYSDQIVRRGRDWVGSKRRTGETTLRGARE